MTTDILILCTYAFAEGAMLATPAPAIVARLQHAPQIIRKEAL